VCIVLISDGELLDYNGKVNFTANSVACQRWDSHTPHSHDYTDVMMYPEKTLGDAANYCRSVDTNYAWCYTTDPNIEWVPCNVTMTCDNTDGENNYFFYSPRYNVAITSLI
jgi:hypothetical protein